MPEPLVIRYGAKPSNRIRISSEDGFVLVKRSPVSRLTPAEAMRLADALVDHAESIEQPLTKKDSL